MSSCHQVSLMGASRAMLLIGTFLFCLTSVAQQDLQIIVNGPWSYVADPTPPGKLWLVTSGASTHHSVYVYPGVNAAAWSGMHPPTNPLSRGSYAVTFDGSFASGTAPNPPDPKSLEQVTLCGGTVGSASAVINNVGNTNYVIALPMPQSFSTYIDSNYVWDGYSESKNSNAPVAPTVAPGIFTTTMVLHYWVRTVPNQVLLNGANISTIGSGSSTPLGITIVSGDPNAYDDDLQCDTISSESVAERNSVWSLHQYAAFPEESDMTGHQTHHYRPCPSSSMSMNSKSKMTASQKKEFCIAHDGTPAGDKCMVSGGSADCHACQMTVNGAIPGANVPITIVH